METCDVCNTSTAWGEGTAYTADEFRTIVSMGFEPEETFFRVTAALGVPGTLVLAQWKHGLVANSKTGWLLCPRCAARAAKYMPKPAGTGLGGHILSETVTPAMLLAPLSEAGFLPGPASQAKREPKSVKKWWQFWKARSSPVDHVAAVVEQPQKKEAAPSSPPVDYVDAVVEQPQKEEAAPSSPVNVTIDGTSFPLVTSVAALCAAIEAGGKGVLRFPSLSFSKVLVDLTQRLEKRYGRTSRQYKDSVPSPLVCADCLWDFPDSYVLSLQGVLAHFSSVSGAIAGFDQFGTSGICPQCGSRESLLVYEYFPPAQISESDVAAIRRYWQQQARTWWQSQQRQEAICKWCDTTVIARYQGYLSGSSIYCEECVTKGLMTEGLEKLKGNPHYYGNALLRKARHFRP